ncbi:MAG: hypothetical protein JO110_24390 [Acetobacteraceae bacterium]|nr:hypothetical protein [Acetobacteraceae bacterium]
MATIIFYKPKRGSRLFRMAGYCRLLNRSVHYGSGPPPGSPLARWHERIRERRSVAVTFAQFDAAVERRAAASEAYTMGERRREYRDHRLEWMVKSGGIEVVLPGLRDGNVRFPWPNE